MLPVPGSQDARLAAWRARLATAGQGTTKGRQKSEESSSLLMNPSRSECKGFERHP
jgi:hypothetical protein